MPLSQRLVLAPLGLDGPDGRPLCRYPLDDATCTALITHLSSRGPDVANIAADFALTAAELWRRHYDGGLWTWDPIVSRLGWDAVPNALLTTLVTRGLAYWDRPLVRLLRHEYLGSIAREAGIPLRVLTRDSGAIHDFLKTLLGDIRDFGRPAALALALALAPRLPERLRQPTFLDLAVDLATSALDLAAAAAIAGLPSHHLTPADLDRALPTWRDVFAVRLDHDAALALMAGLVDAARTPAPPRPLRATVHLALAPHRLTRALRLPPDLDARALAALVDLPPDALPPRLDLLSDTPQGVTLLALLVRRDGTTTYRVDPLRDTTTLPTPLDAPLTLALRAQGRVLGRFIPPGGAPLGDLPWVFSPTPPDGPWRLTAEGACRFADEVLVLVPPGYTLDPPAPGAPATLLGRTLHRLTETTQLLGPDDLRCILRRAATPSDTLYALSGRRHPLAPDVFVGPPTVTAIAPNGAAVPVPLTRLQVHDGTAWRPLSAAPRGQLRLRVSDPNDGVVHQTRVACLPPATQLTLTPESSTRALLTLTAPDAPLATVRPTPDLTATITGGTPGGPTRWRLDAPATVATFDLALRWPDGAALTLTLRFPRRGQRFVTPAGAALPPATLLPLDALHTAVAEAWTPAPTATARFQLEAHLRAADVPDEAHLLGLLQPDPAPSTRHTLPLYALAKPLARLLALSSTASATVRLRILDHTGAHDPHAELTIAHFDAALTVDRDAGLAHTDPPQPAAFALRIATPDERIPLPPVAPPGTFALAPLDGRPGAWMIFGAADGRTTTAPKLRRILSDTAPPPNLSPLIDAVERPRHAQRATAFAAALTILAAAPDAPDWALVHRYLALLDTFPASTFEAIRALTDAPEALTLALLTSAAPTSLVRALDALPWHWATLPVTALTHALTRHHAWLATLVPVATADALTRDAALGALAPLTERYPGLAVARAAAVARALPALAPHFPSPELGLAAAAPQVLHAQLSAAMNEARQRDPDDTHWPALCPLDALAARLRPLSPPFAALLAPVPSELVPILRAPLLVAACAAQGLLPTPTQAFTFSLAEAFDRDYFVTAHSLALTLALA